MLSLVVTKTQGPEEGITSFGNEPQTSDFPRMVMNRPAFKFYICFQVRISGCFTELCIKHIPFEWDSEFTPYYDFVTN